MRVLLTTLLLLAASTLPARAQMGLAVSSGLQVTVSEVLRVRMGKEVEVAPGTRAITVYVSANCRWRLLVEPRDGVKGTAWWRVRSSAAGPLRSTRGGVARGAGEVAAGTHGGEIEVVVEYAAPAGSSGAPPAFTLVSG
jgi:hypothetical protein